METRNWDSERRQMMKCECDDERKTTEGEQRRKDGENAWLASRACKRSGKRSGAGQKSSGAERSGELALQKNDGAERSGARSGRSRSGNGAWSGLNRPNISAAL